MFTKSTLTPLLVFILSCSYLNAASIKGKILHAETKDALIGALVWVKGTSNGVHTDLSGEFVLDGLTAGNYILNASYLGYKPSSDIEVVLQNDTEEKYITIQLEEIYHNTKEVMVTGKLNSESDISARKQEKESDNVMNVVSARSIELSPDINTANVVQRISGITMVRTAQGDARYAIIRGMDPRYSNTLINGIKVPSPDNDTRFVPLDMIPSDLLQNLVVTKSLNPDMEADATAGTINAVMKDAPDTTFASVNGNIGYNQTFFDRPYSRFDAGSIERTDPGIKYPADHVFKASDFSRKNLVFNNLRPDPNTVFGFTYGRRLVHKKLGVILSATNQISFSGAQTQLQSWTHSFGVDVINDLTLRTTSSRQNRSGVNFKMDYRFNENHKISFSNVYLRMVLDETQEDTDTTFYNGGNGRIGPGTGYLAYTKRSRLNIQQIESGNLHGEHTLLKRFLFDWSAVLAYATTNQPDIASLNTHQLINVDHIKEQEYFSNATRIWQYNNDKDRLGNANLQYLSNLFGGKSTLKIGGLYRYKTRDNHQNNFTLYPVKINQQDPPFVSAETVGWYVYGGKGTPIFNQQNYTAQEYILDYYFQQKLEFKKWNVVYGIRFEKTEQHWYVPYTILTHDKIANSPRPLYTDILPSINLKYLVNEKMNLKFAFYKSIVRPQFAEFIPTRTGPSTDNWVTIGNPIIKHSIIFNYEVRYEWFINPKDVLMLGLFTKHINNAIEYAINLGGQNTTFERTPYNVENAQVQGLEFNLIKYFKKVSLIRNFGINFNYTYTYSVIKDNTKQFVPYTSNQNNLVTIAENRTLQNQSKDIYNCTLLYNLKKIGLNLQVSYLYQGERLVNIQTYQGLNWTQKPLKNLSFSAEQKIKSNFFVTVKLNNLLNSPYVAYIKSLDEIVQKSYYGQSYQLGLRYVF